MIIFRAMSSAPPGLRSTSAPRPANVMLSYSLDALSTLCSIMALSSTVDGACRVEVLPAVDVAEEAAAEGPQDGASLAI